MSEEKQLSQAPKQFLIRHFSSNQQCEDWLNEQWPMYEPVNISDTKDYITVLVRLTRTDMDLGHTFHLQVGKGDMGKVIGVNGRTARALRTILINAAARYKLVCSLDIVEVAR